MIVGIDASNLRSGGSIAHLCELISATESKPKALESVIVWAGKHLIARLPQRPWLHAVYQPQLDQPLAVRTWWQRVQLPRLLRKGQCDILFAPGGTFPLSSPCPTVTMSRNMLPFEPREAKRYGLSQTRLRLALLRWSQAQAFHQADGVVFLTHYARDRVQSVLGSEPRRTALIPHGVAERFRREPRPQAAIGKHSSARPLQLLYISIVDLYKHQWHVAEAIGWLRQQGCPITIDFVGPAYAPALRRLQAVRNKWDPAGSYLRYSGPIKYADLHHCYHQADMFIFASSCENMPNILVEAMAAGLPIACARRGPMPEILGDAGVYFDPENPQDIAQALHGLLMAPAARARCALAAYERAQQYSWERCAHETFDFLADVAQRATAKRV